MDFKRLDLQNPRQKIFYRKKYFKLLFVIAVVVVTIAVWSFLSSTSSVFQFYFFNNPLKSTNNRVNILLLGNAGGTHAGAELTDSIIVASYHPKTHKVILISIPRDLWISGINTKVNALYEIGEQQKYGGEGLKFAKEELGDILGIPIHYSVRVDFSGFAKSIDLVGGIDFEVPKTFDDYNYPVEGKEEDPCDNTEKEVELTEEELRILNLKPGKQKVLVTKEDKVATSAADFPCRFEHIHFDKGLTHMDGETALKFIRSRMGTAGEGSDFARSRRQQLTLQAFRDQVLSIKTLTNPKTMLDVLQTLGRSVDTDIPPDRFLDLYGLVKKIDGVSSIVLGDLGAEKKLLISPPVTEYGSYVLIPPDNDFTTIKNFIKEELKK